LTDELAQARAAAVDPPARIRADPVKGDPFRDFANFASHALTLDTQLTASPRVTVDDVRAAGRTALDTAFPSLRAPPQLCAEAFAVLAGRPGGAAVRDVLLAFPTPQRRIVEM